jgi:hypothetical protein
MNDKWVDTTKYFGPDRRKRGGKRWGDRRTLDEGGKRPPLGAMLRRLRVHLTGVALSDDPSQLMQILTAAIAEAEMLRYPQCADALKLADRSIRVGGANAIADAETHVSEAIDHASLRR